jgi:predicted enzyme related to lactoylglutathione lyase
MKLKFSRIILFVNDVSKTAKFYRDAFDLKVKGKINKEWTELDAGGCSIALHKSSMKTIKDHDSKAKLVFGSRDVPATKSFLEKKGIAMGEIITFDSIQLCNGKDPEGNPFQISSRGISDVHSKSPASRRVKFSKKSKK